MMSRNFRVAQRNVRSLAAHDHARLGERMALALGRARKNAENDILVRRQLQAGIGWRQIQIRTGGTGTGEGGPSVRQARIASASWLWNPRMKACPEPWSHV